MGNYLTQSVPDDPQDRGRKRKVEDIDENDEQKSEEDILNTPKRAGRSANYSGAELELLLQLCEQYHDILSGAPQPPGGLSQEDVWKIIEEKMLGVGPERRFAAQLRRKKTKWFSAVKEKAGLIKHRRNTTGLGGEGKRSSMLTPMEERICALMGEVTYAGVEHAVNARTGRPYGGVTASHHGDGDVTVEDEAADNIVPPIQDSPVAKRRKAKEATPGNSSSAAQAVRDQGLILEELRTMNRQLVEHGKLLQRIACALENQKVATCSPMSPAGATQGATLHFPVEFACGSPMIPAALQKSRRKVKSTSRYIYQTLFVNGENSDVTIVALGKRWSLHRIYLGQSTYFSGMFSGAWRESKDDVIHMDITDQNIDHEALEITFGSLYQDDVSIRPSQVTSVLAAATLLGLDGLIQQCVAIMSETISAVTVCCYHASAVMYGIPEVSNRCFDWLEKNLMTSQTPELLKEISIDLMGDIIASASLVVVQVEMDVYTLLKKWVFLQIHPAWAGNPKELGANAEAYFKVQNADNKVPFLMGEAGLPYIDVFRGVRVSHIINDFSSARTVEEDSILPQEWLLPVYRHQWLQMLRVEQAIDKGAEEGATADFDAKSLRVGRVLVKDTQYCWRWTGYNYGLDLLVSVTNRLLTFKRNTTGQASAGAVSMTARRHLLYKLTVVSLDQQGQTRYSKTTGVKQMALGKDEEVVVLNIDRKISFPLHVSANFLYFSPLAIPPARVAFKQYCDPEDASAADDVKPNAEQIPTEPAGS